MKEIFNSEKSETLKEKCENLRSTTDFKVNKGRYLIIMLDGHHFSKYVKNNFQLPFDNVFIDFMNNTALKLMKEIQNSMFAFVQSDEISIVCDTQTIKGNEPIFGGRLCKIQSIYASIASNAFNKLQVKNFISNHNALGDLHENIDNLENKFVEFDCKAWCVDDFNDVFCHFLWRQRDCIRNSKQQAARSYISHNRLLNKNTQEQIALLKNECGIDWNEYDDGKKYGRFIVKDKEHFYNKELGIEYDRNILKIKEGEEISAIDELISFVNLDTIEHIEE